MMTHDLIVAVFAFGAGVIETLVVLALGYAMGRVSKGLTSGVGEIIADVRSDRYPSYEYPPDDMEQLDDDYFDKARRSPEEGGHKFPTDEELEHINRHANG